MSSGAKMPERVTTDRAAYMHSVKEQLENGCPETAFEPRLRLHETCEFQQDETFGSRHDDTVQLRHHPVHYQSKACPRRGVPADRSCHASSRMNSEPTSTNPVWERAGHASGDGRPAWELDGSYCKRDNKSTNKCHFLGGC